MSVKGAAGIAAMLALGCGVDTQAAPRTETIALLTDIDSRFICPEILPSDADRSAALASFAKRLAASNITYVQATHILDLMLRRHNCAATVAGPAPTEAAPVDAERLPAPVTAVASIAPGN